MAVIGKIREKAGWAIGLIALGLGLFIVGADFFGPKSNLFSNDAEVGKIAGHGISAKEFEAEVEQIKATMAMQGQNPTEQQLQQIREQVWQDMIFRYAYQPQFEKLGIGLSPEERDDMIAGDNIHTSIKQTQVFQNASGQFDRTMLDRYLDYIESDSARPQDKQLWENFIVNQLPQMRMREKYDNLLRTSLYVTQAEAQHEYEAQVAKVDAKYIYVPYYSIPDSTIKVSDDELKTYLSAHKNQYKGDETRSLKYVTFPIMPSAKDSADLKSQLVDLAKQLAVAPNDSSFAIAESEIEVPGNGSYQVIGALPQEIQNTISTLIPGSINGPFQDGNEYYIFKYDGAKDDSIPSLRASHILFNLPKGASDSVKAQTRKQAEDVLKQIKDGASFEALAQQYGSDGTAQRGGDLGWFSKNGQMVKEFEGPIFSFNGSGLLPNLVETEYGYHIVKVTQPKTYKKYKVAVIRKSIVPSEATRNEVYRKASAIGSQAKDIASFEEAVKKDPTLSAYTADRLQPQATSINTLVNARSIVQWAFKDDTKVGTVSTELFELDNPNQYVIAVLTGKSEKGSPSVDAYRAELTNKVRNQKKAEQIISKLGDLSGTLDAIAQKYGAQAQVLTGTDITMGSNSLPSVGMEPAALGKAFGLKVGQKSKAIKGENGVIVMEVTKQTPAPQIADYTQYKTQLKQNKSFSVTYLAGEAIKEDADIEDLRYKFY
ncbi:peptidylprolyl isomerase [Xanthocytophaga agilis]|uniref:Periplasmic chaperone PpiD n=1 Tax=Xanthocytophaga agilis TaxID=3048010 RepID=A0AAE3R2Q0_9BACT|nr:peptidylprolyl isomerase [Xanthocytophaga agilis]MDJ1502581.1 SurA N-terminal domain-containing protein [Xanthocytophaga agilis]